MSTLGQKLLVQTDLHPHAWRASIAAEPLELRRQAGSSSRLRRLPLSRKTLEEATDGESKAGAAATPMMHRAVSQALPPDARPSSAE